MTRLAPWSDGGLGAADRGVISDSGRLSAWLDRRHRISEAPRRLSVTMMWDDAPRSNVHRTAAHGMPPQDGAETSRARALRALRTTVRILPGQARQLCRTHRLHRPELPYLSVAALAVRAPRVAGHAPMRSPRSPRSLPACPPRTTVCPRLTAARAWGALSGRWSTHSTRHTVCFSAPVPAWGRRRRSKNESKQASARLRSRSVVRKRRLHSSRRRRTDGFRGNGESGRPGAECDRVRVRERERHDQRQFDLIGGPSRYSGTSPTLCYGRLYRHFLQR